jgi:hypothetical protein
MLEAFRDAVRDCGPVLTDAPPGHGATMRVAADVYRMVGRQPRTPVSHP